MGAFGFCSSINFLSNRLPSCGSVMADVGRLTCALSFMLLVGVASAAFYPTPIGYSVKNDDSLNTRTRDGNIARIIFQDEAPDFALEFLSTTGPASNYGPDATFYLSVVIRPFDAGYPWIPVWGANRDTPVRQNATLNVELAEGTNQFFTLVLRDADGTLVWQSSNGLFTEANDIGVDMGSNGNFRLLDNSNNSVWESWQQPTDTLVPGQTLAFLGQLVSAASTTNYASGEYMFNARVAGITMTTASSSEPYYWKSTLPNNNTVYAVEHTCNFIHNTFFNVARGLVIFKTDDANLPSRTLRDETLCGQEETPGDTVVIAPFPSAGPPFDGSETVTTYQFARMDPDGVLRVYSYSIASRAWFAVSGAQVPPA